MPLYQVSLSVLKGARSTKVALRLPTKIGRGEDAKIKVRHSLVSRHHCELFEQSGLVCVHDLGSANGTYVNDKRISEGPYPLRDGDELRVGQVTFLVHLKTLAADASTVRNATAAASDVAVESTLPVAGSPGVDPPTGNEAPREDSDVFDLPAFLKYQENSEGSFIGIATEDPSADPVSGFSGIDGPIEFPLVDDSIDIHNDGKTAAQVHPTDDSKLRRFLGDLG
jgi:predicted component of type VI protein secretion system